MRIIVKQLIITSMNNEILTDELAQMNEQIKKMKEILSRQSIVNETLIKNVTRTRIKQLRSSDHAKAVMGVVGIASLLMLHYGMHLSIFDGKVYASQYLLVCNGCM